MAGDLRDILSCTVAWYHRASNPIMRVTAYPVCAVQPCHRRRSPSR